MMATVHFISLVAAVFSVFERHDLNFELSQKSSMLRQAFYLNQVLMIIPTILWFLVVTGNYNNALPYNMNQLLSPPLFITCVDQSATVEI